MSRKISFYYQGTRRIGLSLQIRRFSYFLRGVRAGRNMLHRKHLQAWIKVGWSMGVVLVVPPSATAATATAAAAAAAAVGHFLGL